jgi:hypothetical protein
MQYNHLFLRKSPFTFEHHTMSTYIINHRVKLETFKYFIKYHSSLCISETKYRTICLILYNLIKLVVENVILPSSASRLDTGIVLVRVLQPVK